MPKKIFARLLSDIEQDVAASFTPGQRYRTIREIADRFGVSQQTAQRAVTVLSESGILASRSRSGVYVSADPRADRLTGKEILVISTNPDPRFNDAFLDGIGSVAGEVGMSASLLDDRPEHPDSLAFGERLDREYSTRDVGGIIALAFRDADLAFYHLLTKGRLVVSDVNSHRLPMLPSVQSDNQRHSEEAARLMAERGKTSILVAGYWAKGNVRHAAFEQAFRSLVPEGQCRYVHLSEDLSTADLYLFFRRFSKKDGVFAVDYSANHTVAPYFLAHNVSPDGNLLVYDSEYDTFQFRGLPPIHSAAPSLYTLGTRLARKLVDRIRTGEWSEPLQERT
jgi:DNA-binding LacI/PurR family transcriptional regulator